MRVAVVGRGLIGSAAARHLAAAGHEVTLFGPDEPADKARHRGVFGSHYDEGRITRGLATTPFWAKVSIASISRYGEIAAQSGIGFYTPCGAMMAGPSGGAFIAGAAGVRAELGIESAEYSGAALRARFPYFAFPDGFRAFHETVGGHVSPRALVRAQVLAAKRLGARLVPEEVGGLHATARGVELRTASGSHAADAALIATGAMTDHVAPRRLSQRVYARTVALFEVDAAEIARLAGMPSLVFRLDRPGEPYLLPPIRYPDGKHYLKIGGDPVDVRLHSPREIGDWFRSGGNPAVRDHLEGLIRPLMPGLAFRAVRMDACVTTFTPSGRPVIDRLDPRIAVASGGNGAGAKCSDELGRLGALAVTGGADPLLEETRLSAETDA